MIFRKLIFVLFFSSFHPLLAQYTATTIRHHIKLEATYLKFYTSTLSKQTETYRFMEDGLQFNAVWDWDFDEKRYMGLGLGYLAIGEAKGASAFGEINFFVSNGILNPYIGIRGGYSILKDVKNDIHSDMMAAFLIGLQIRLGVYAYPAIFLQTGLQYDQKTLFMPLTVGYKF